MILGASVGRVRIILLAGALVAAGLASNPLTLPQVAEVLVKAFRRMGLEDGRFRLYFFNKLAMSVALLLTFAASATLASPRPGEADLGHLKRQAKSPPRPLL